MNLFGRLLFLLAAASTLAVSAGVIVIALAFALYALAEPYVGRAGASACVALAAAVFIGLMGALLALMGRKPKRKPNEPESISDRVVDFVKSRPVTAVGGAIAAGILAVRNPKYLGLAIRAFVEGRERSKGGKRRA